MENPRYPGLQLDEDMKLQLREWRIQRIAWLLLYALLAAIVLGLLGGGPLSHSSAMTQDGTMKAEYERFMRHCSSETLRMTIAPSPGPLRLQVAGEYIRKLEIKKIFPEPEAVIPGTDDVTFVFRTASSGANQIAFHFQSEKVGSLEGWVAREGEQQLVLRHFVYP